MNRLLSTAAALAIFCGLMWFAWLGWDHEYYLVDGVAQGPYRPWQVVGAGLTVAFAAAIMWLRVRTNAAIFALAAAAATGFAVAWGQDAARTDDTGLWGVGLLGILIGGGTALTVMLALLSTVVPPRPRTA